MPNALFPKDFVWGAATAAYQIEGAAAEDGKGESIWDRFCRIPGAIRGGESGEIACDHYHRYREDVELMRRVGLSGYRFSIAWSRVLPSGKGKPNPAGIAFYDRLIDALLEAGIEPSATLYHWDLPAALQDSGGWANRDTVHRFSDYASLMFERYGDRVPRWYTLNEPWVTAFAGHYAGRHAPGLKDPETAVGVSHILLLSHAEALEAYRDSGRTGEIGIVLNLYPTEPATDSGSDHDAARFVDGYHNRWFLDPLYRGSYPAEVLERFSAHGMDPDIREGDLEYIVRHGTDFLGVNYYFRKIVRASPTPAVLEFEEIVPEGARTTEMGWEVYAPGLYTLLTRLSAEYGNPRIFVTENGAAFPDTKIEDGVVQDDDRVEYLSRHIREAARAVESGVRLEGYYVWSLLDNFEWAHGYSKRFGLFRVEYDTQERLWKKSARWYRSVIEANGPSDPE